MADNTHNAMIIIRFVVILSSFSCKIFDWFHIFVVVCLAHWLFLLLLWNLAMKYKVFSLQ